MAPQNADGGRIRQIYGGIIMNMRQQMVKSVEDVMNTDSSTITLLGDIGVWGFRNAKADHPERVYNIGILEQATVSVAAGLAKTGMIPIVHTIAPFIVERPYEQLMIDFGYQQLGGNFISVGASYDYSALGFTHYCPADVNILAAIPNMQIVLPGTAAEFDTLFKAGYNNGMPTYYRLSERSNSIESKVEFGRANVIKKGDKGTVIAVGPMLDNVLKAVKDLDVTLLYYTTVTPFDYDTLLENCVSGKIIICEPYYSGAVSRELMNDGRFFGCSIANIGIEKQYISKYGSIEELDTYLGLDDTQIYGKIRKLI